MEGVKFRIAGPGDSHEIGRTLALAFEGYRAFAPDGWDPPGPEAESVRERLTDPAIWCLVAEHDSTMAGHVALMPATIHGVWPVRDPKLANLWQMFVREPFWGTGLATELHSAVIEEARGRGYARFRLFTPAGQARARRFYEREGWALTAPPFFEERFGMELVEYRRSLG